LISLKISVEIEFATSLKVSDSLVTMLASSILVIDGHMEQLQ
jgi:hypothetical protein